MRETARNVDVAVRELPDANAVSLGPTPTLLGYDGEKVNKSFGVNANSESFGL